MHRTILVIALIAVLSAQQGTVQDLLSIYGDHTTAPGLFGAHAPVTADAHEECRTSWDNICMNGCNRPCVRSPGKMCCNRGSISQETCLTEGSAWCGAEGFPMFEEDLFSLEGGAHNAIPGLMGSFAPTEEELFSLEGGAHNIIPGLMGGFAPSEEEMHEQVMTCTTSFHKNGRYNVCTNGCNRPCRKNPNNLCCTRNPLNVNEEECKAENSAWCNADGIPHVMADDEDLAAQTWQDWTKLGLKIGEDATNLGIGIARKAGGNKQGLDIAESSADSAFDMVNKIIGGFGQKEMEEEELGSIMRMARRYNCFTREKWSEAKTKWCRAIQEKLSRVYSEGKALMDRHMEEERHMEEDLAWLDSEGIVRRNSEWTPEFAGHMEEELAWLDSEGIVRRNSEWTPEFAGHMEEELAWIDEHG